MTSHLYSLVETTRRYRRGATTIGFNEKKKEKLSSNTPSYLEPCTCIFEMLRASSHENCVQADLGINNLYSSNIIYLCNDVAI